MIVALTGKIGAGKTTAAKALCRDFRLLRVSFADTLREMALHVVPHRDFLESKKHEIIQELGCTGRRIMQTLGTEWGRDTISQDVWVMAWKRKVLQTKTGILGCRGVIADDLRFNNEAHTVKELGGTIIQIVRTVEYATEAPSDHASEAGIDQGYVHHTVLNEGTEAELIAKVATILNNTPKLPSVPK